MSERRKHTRYAIKAKAKMRVDRDIFDCTLVDISVNGSGVSAMKNIAPGSKIAIELDLAANITIFGNVIFVIDETVTGKGGYHLGIQNNGINFNGDIAISESERTKMIELVIEELNSI